MGSTVIGGVTYPEAMDQPLVPADIRRAAEEIMRSAMPRFGSVAERSAAYATLGITPTRGATCWLDSALRLEVYTGADWAAMPGTILARGYRATSSGSTTTEVGVLRIDDVPIILGQVYKVYTSALVPDTSVANDVMNAKIRFTTDGSIPTTASAVLPGSEAQVRQPDANNGESINILTVYTPTPTNQTLSLLLTIARTAGTGNVVLFADGNFATQLILEAGGFDPGDTGVDI